VRGHGRQIDRQVLPSGACCTGGDGLEGGLVCERDEWYTLAGDSNSFNGPAIDIFLTFWYYILAYVDIKS
jgi:hypothetical protein